MCSAYLACRWLGRLFGKLFSTAFPGPPLGRPAWLCPGPAKMEKKIAAKMLLTSVEIGSKTLPGGSKNRSKMALGGLQVPPLGRSGALLGPPGTLVPLEASEIVFSNFSRKAQNRRQFIFFVVFGLPGALGRLWGRPGCSSVALGWLCPVMSYEAATELSGPQRKPTGTQLRSLFKSYHQ